MHMHKRMIQVNSYNPGCLFVGHRQTVQKQIRRHNMWRLIRFSTVSLQKFLINLNKNESIGKQCRPDQPPQNAASDQVLHCLLTEVSFKI